MQIVCVRVWVCVCGDNHPVACSSFHFDDVGLVSFLFGRLISCEWILGSFQISKHEYAAASTHIPIWTYWDLCYPYTLVICGVHAILFSCFLNKKSFFLRTKKNPCENSFVHRSMISPSALPFHCLPTPICRVTNLNLMQIVHNCSTISSTWNKIDA